MVKNTHHTETFAFYAHDGSCVGVGDIDIVGSRIDGMPNHVTWAGRRFYWGAAHGGHYRELYAKGCACWIEREHSPRTSDHHLSSMRVDYHGGRIAPCPEIRRNRVD